MLGVLSDYKKNRCIIPVELKVCVANAPKLGMMVEALPMRFYTLREN